LVTVNVFLSVFNSRRIHSYATAVNRVFRGLGISVDSSVTESNSSQFSGVTGMLSSHV